MNRIGISDAFECGNIEHSDTRNIDEDSSFLVKLRIKPDMYTELEKTCHSQYFCFRATVNNPSTVKYSIENASEVSYPTAWKGSTVCFTENMADTNSWRRNLATAYEDGKLTWTHDHVTGGSVYFSYIPPYTYARHLELIAKCTKYASVQSLGQTLDGREMECVSTGTGPLVAWIIHRQHPGESQAEFFAEGLLNRLLGLDSEGEVDGMVYQLRKDFTIYIVPCMCPDGAVRGHLRTNAAGANLNREWADSPNYTAPTLERSPEVYHVLHKMDATGVDCFLDIHGDEELPFNFCAGAEETQHWGPRLQGLHGAFVAAYARANSDMQAKIGYNPPPPGAGRRFNNIATAAIANRFNCLALTLEMPFKDCHTNPDPERGWSTSRSRKLGASALDALAYVQPWLHTEEEFWNNLPAADAYVQPSHRYQIS